MKRGIRLVLKILIILMLLAAFLIFVFPKLFWAFHARSTKQLAVSLIPGETDLEYAYGQDEKEPVEALHLSMDGINRNELAIFFPASMIETRDSYPIVVWGNGTGNTYENYRAGLMSLASYGFIVVGCSDSNMGSGETLYAIAKYACEWNSEPGNPFYGRIDTAHIGVAGHSQGACGAINAATKFPESETLFSMLFTTSLPKPEMCVDNNRYQFSYWAYDVSKISMPYFSTTGTWFLDSLWISPKGAMETQFAEVPADVPVYMARQKGANHNIVNEYHGCGYFNAWCCYTLNGDKTAAAVFTGDTELGHNPSRWSDFLSR